MKLSVSGNIILVYARKFPHGYYITFETLRQFFSQKINKAIDKSGIAVYNDNAGVADDGHFLKLKQITASLLDELGGYLFLSVKFRMTMIVVISDKTNPENCNSCSKVM